MTQTYTQRKTFNELDSDALSTGGGVFVSVGLSYVTVAGLLHRAGFSQFTV